MCCFLTAHIQSPTDTRKHRIDCAESLPFVFKTSMTHLITTSKKKKKNYNNYMLYIKGHPDVTLSFLWRKTRLGKKQAHFHTNTKILKDKISIEDAIGSRASDKLRGSKGTQWQWIIISGALENNKTHLQSKESKRCQIVGFVLMLLCFPLCFEWLLMFLLTFCCCL